MRLELWSLGSRICSVFHGFIIIVVFVVIILIVQCFSELLQPFGDRNIHCALSFCSFVIVFPIIALCFNFALFRRWCNFRSGLTWTKNHRFCLLAFCGLFSILFLFFD
mmetsp:Transcript_47920/g.137976  ORF Transcript_47920/g.137976 Transcript_47920/m.137976 type:complete len:108 (+) Transcript_47920:252-575(+)